MADKGTTVYIVDLGKSMGEKNGGRKETDLDWAMTYVWEKITSTVGRLCSASRGMLIIIDSSCQEDCHPRCPGSANRSYELS